jgi:HD-GYP domain-containing protein (c-di-GMP phosphodiesterase class II)
MTPSRLDAERAQYEGVIARLRKENAILQEVNRGLAEQLASTKAWSTAACEQIANLNAQAAQLRGALEQCHAKMSEECNVYFEQDGKPIDICIDLGEAYQESSLCEQVYAALHNPVPSVVDRDKAKQIAECIAHIKRTALGARCNPAITVAAIGLSACGGEAIARELGLVEDVE